MRPALAACSALLAAALLAGCSAGHRHRSTRSHGDGDAHGDRDAEPDTYRQRAGRRARHPVTHAPPGETQAASDPDPDTQARRRPQAPPDAFKDPEGRPAFRAVRCPPWRVLRTTGRSRPYERGDADAVLVSWRGAGPLAQRLTKAPPPIERPTMRPLSLALPALLAAACLTACGGGLAAPVQTVTATAPAPTATETVAPATPSPAEADESAPTPAAAEQVPKKQLPNVVGMNLQAGQDAMQAAGFYVLNDKDATGQNRFQVYDRNWVVTKQSPAAGRKVSVDTLITLYAKKIGE